MLFIKKTKERINTVDTQSQLKILSRWNSCKQRFAANLQQKSEALSIQAKKYSLIFFCLLFGGSSIAIIIHAATTKGETVTVTAVKRANPMQSEKIFLQADSSITKREYDRVLQFEQYLLQLKNDAAGKQRFDSIIQARHGLLDSIKLFEKIYSSQK